MAYEEGEVRKLLLTRSYSSSDEESGDEPVMVRKTTDKPRCSHPTPKCEFFSLVTWVVTSLAIGFLTGIIVFNGNGNSANIRVDVPKHTNLYYNDKGDKAGLVAKPVALPEPGTAAVTGATTTTAATVAAQATTTEATTSTTTAATPSAAAPTAADDEADTDDSSTTGDDDDDDNADDEDNENEKPDENIDGQDDDDDDDDEDTQEESNEPLQYFKAAHTDRSGSALCDYLLLNSYAYATNATYGGACWDMINWTPLVRKHGEKYKKTGAARLKVTKQLTALIGLSKELPFACPKKGDLESGKAIEFKTRGTYKHPGYTVEWIRYIQSKSTFQYAPPKGSEEPVDAVMHVRRGDFTPCHVTDRYLSNSYYIKVKDKYIKPLCDAAKNGCKITLYSEKDTWESFEPFRAWPNLTFDFSSTLEEIWTHFMNADAFVMSRSSFSQVPAMMNRGNHIYSPYVIQGEFGMEEDIPTWTKVDMDIYNEALAYSQDIYKNECTPLQIKGTYESWYNEHPEVSPPW